MHDSLGIIAQDPEFGKNLASAINSMQLPAQYRRQDVPAYWYMNGVKSSGVDYNAAEVIESHHADTYAVVAVGGNTGENLGEYFLRSHPDKLEGQLELLKNLADALGYRLVKKSAKKV